MKMKKLLGVIVGLAVLVGLGNVSQADCLDVRFDNGDSICISLDKSGNRYYASVQNNSSPSLRSVSLRCEILLPNQVLEDLGACNGYFSYASSRTERVKMYVRYDNRYFETIDADFNFSNGTWTSGGGGGGGGTTSNVTVSTNRSSPSTNERVNVTVRADRNYNDVIYFSLEYRDGYAWKSATTSDYNADSYFNNGYRFTYSDYGEKTFNSFIRFYRSAQYRLYVRDYRGNRNYVEFNVGGGGGGTTSDVTVSTNRSSPSTNERVNVTVRADRNYSDYVYFSLEYRDGYAWKSATTSDYNADNYFNNGYRFTYSDYGEKTFNSFIRFYRSAQYRLYVRDYRGNRNYVEFNVGGGGGTTSDVTVSTNRSSPNTNERVNVTVRADRNYSDYVYFSLEYRDGYAWKSATTSDYNADNYFNNGYRFTYSDYGERTFNSFIRFYRSAQYRLYVRDYRGNRNYVEFNVGGGGGTTSNVTVSTNRSFPGTNERVNITVRADRNYTDVVYFSLEYRDGYTWRAATTSDYNADSYFNNGYRFTYSDYGERTFNSFIRFYRSAQYRLYVKDYRGNRNYVEFNVGGGGGGTSVNGFSSSEYRKITNVSRIWNDVVAELKRTYYTLRNDSYWQRLSDTLYTNMIDVVNNRSNRVFYNYNDFLRAFNEWFRYTSNNV